MKCCKQNLLRVGVNFIFYKLFVVLSVEICEIFATQILREINFEGLHSVRNSHFDHFYNPEI